MFSLGECVPAVVVIGGVGVEALTLVFEDVGSAVGILTAEQDVKFELERQSIYGTVYLHLQGISRTSGEECISFSPKKCKYH
jgi:hypothetical protein